MVHALRSNSFRILKNSANEFKVYYNICVEYLDETVMLKSVAGKSRNPNIKRLYR